VFSEGSKINIYHILTFSYPLFVVVFERGEDELAETALRATMRNSILAHAALYRYQPAEQSYCYVRHYGTGQASAETDDLADPAEERRPGKRQRVEDAPEAAQQVP
jgi:hypothetical protein